MRSAPRHWLLRYGSAVAAILLATLIRGALQPVLESTAPFVTFLVTVMFVARYVGLGPALFALVLGALSATWFFIVPYHSMAIQGAPGFITVALYLFVGLTHSFLCESLRAAERRAERNAADAIGKQHELERQAVDREQILEWLRSIAAEARCILWQADVEDRGARYLKWDLKVVDEPAAQRFFPVSIPDGLTYVQAWYESRLPEDKIRMGQWGDGQVRAGQSYTQEFRCRRLDGEIRWLAEEVQIEPVAPGRWRAVGVCLDVTERKLAEEALRESEARFRNIAIFFALDLTQRRQLEADLVRQTEELREADRRKDEFLAVLAHELRNPLAPIRNAVALLRHVAADDARLARAREIIERQVTHQARLLDDLLDISRITRGLITPHRADVDLVRLVRDAAEDSQSVLEAAGLTLYLDLPAQPVWVEGDATRLAQVVGNLLQNCAKFTDSGGRVSFTLETAGDKALITVRDSGIGIAPEMLPRVFEPFSQAERSLDRTRGGLGLGLALVRGIVELHGGEVRAASPGLGQGAVFTIGLPIAVAPGREHAPPPTPPAALPLRVLVVEDNLDAAETLHDLLELFGCTAEVANTGAAAVEAACRFRPEVVLCDLGLPGMDGYQVAEALRREPLTAAARLIAVTGYGQDDDRRRSREAGFDLHLTKPIDVGELQRLLASEPVPAAK